MPRYVLGAGLLALVLAACGSPSNVSDGGAATSGSPPAEQTAADDAPVNEATPTESVAMAPDEETTSTETPASESDDAAVGDGPTPTPDPTMQAFYESFAIPSKGAADAPVVVYEFSDYL